MFDKMKALLDMQKKMQEMKKDLDNTVFETASSDGLVKIKMNGSQVVQEIVIEEKPVDMPRLASVLKDTFNRSIKRSHELAAEKMKNISGLNLPGLL